jgi:tetraacyldisaccharide 4'-kinase
MTLSELIYFAGYSLKKTYFVRRAKQLPFRTISIGNITVGGTGKTPAAIAFAEGFRNSGFTPVILTRGYKGTAKGPCFVRTSPGNAEGPFVSTVDEAGDEPIIMAERLGDIAIVKCADRYEGGQFALRHLCASDSRPFIFILDDGFQHWKLHRDTDIVLVDGLDPFGNGKLLPRGRLREPLEALKRADSIIITRVNNRELSHKLKGISPDVPVFYAVFSADRLRTPEGVTLPTEYLRDKKVLAFCGIGNPEGFRQTMMPLCRELAGFTSFRDHYVYRQKDLAKLASFSGRLGCDLLVTTEKDMVKLKGFEMPESLVCLEISFRLKDTVFDTLLLHQTETVETLSRRRLTPDSRCIAHQRRSVVP